MREVLASGKSNISIQDKTISIYYGQDYFNLQIINFVSMSENPVETARVFGLFLHVFVFRLIERLIFGCLTKGMDRLSVQMFDQPAHVESVAVGESHEAEELLAFRQSGHRREIARLSPSRADVTNIEHSFWALVTDWVGIIGFFPIFRLIDAFIANGKQSVESERLNVSHALQSVGLPSGKVFAYLCFRFKISHF